MKILLSSVGEGCGFNIGLLYLASYTRKYGKGNYEFKVSNDVLADFKTFAPDVVGLYCATIYADLLNDVVSKIKKIDCSVVVVVGGHHVSALAESVVKNKNIDYVVVGEGVQAFLSVLDGESPRGIVKFAPVENLDLIPPPARDLVKIERSDWVYMVTSQGCPYNCVYCSPRNFWGVPRYHSASYVVDEVKGLIEAGYRRICFGDDLFIGNIKRLKEIAGLLKKENLAVELACTVRANLVTSEVCGLFKDMNVRRVSFGAESGCDKTLRYLKDSVTVKDNMNTVKLLKQYGFIVNASFIVGAPGETLADAKETLRFIHDSPFDGVELFTFTPYPGTAAFKPEFMVRPWRDFDVFNREMKFGGAMTTQELQSVYAEFGKIKRAKNLAYMVKRAVSDPLRVKYVFSGRLKKQNRGGSVR